MWVSMFPLVGVHVSIFMDVFSCLTRTVFFASLSNHSAIE